MKVLAAMSGGVDSAVAAARAVGAGWDVTGVHLALSRQPATLRTGSRGCCSVEDSNDARRTADILGIPFYVWDFSERFAADVIEDFVAEYAAGRTPNPCLRCNEKIKFAALLDRALALGFDAVVTGHHARLAGGRLFRSVDAAKDQSYVLAVLTPGQLAHAVFPLGDSTKDQVRAEAARLGLAVATKPDSHDICFIADGDTQAFLDRRLGERAGDIVDTDGTVLGSHAGSHRFTVGQRRGLNLTRPSATGEPRYVLSISPKTNTVVVGGADDLRVGLVHCGPPVWIADPPAGPFECEVQLRAHGMVSPARVVADGAWLQAVLGVPQRGVAAGQALVMYDGEQVLGSATILGTERAAGPDVAQPAAPGSTPAPAPAPAPAGRAGPGPGRMSFPWPPGATTGIGSLPGTDPDEVVRLVLGEVADLPYLPELPGRGFGADLIARTGALLVDLPLEWQPHGWTVASRPGRDLARARDHLSRDLDAVTEHAQGVPLLKVSVCGPLTLAANLELANLHKVLTDHGALRDLTASLTEGVRMLLADLAGRLPGTAIVLQADEPGLPAVLAGEVPTPSGYGTVRSVPRSVAEPALAELLAVAAPGHRVVHCCADRVPFDLLAGAGTSAVSVDAGLLTDATLDSLGELVEAGVSLWLGVFPGTDAPISASEAREKIGRLWGKLGFEPGRLAGAVVPTSSCGLAGASLPYVRRVMAQLRDVGAALRDGLE